MTGPTTPAQDELVEMIEDSVSDPFLSRKNGATEVLLIRHGDALPGAEEVVAGGYDAQALSDQGRRQAAALAEAWHGIPIAAVYSSPIGRARETAQPLARDRSLDVVIEPDLREIELGPIGVDADMKSPEEISAALRTRLRDIAVVALSTGTWDSIPGTEPSAHLRARVRVAVGQIAARHPGERVAVVSHGGAINAYLASVLGIERDYFFPAANTSVSVVRVNGERALLFGLNDVRHLIAAGLFTLE